MQSERHKAASPHLRTVAESHTDLPTSRQRKPDTRRFASIFPKDVPEPPSVDCGDASHEEQNDSDDLSRFESVAALDKNDSTPQDALASLTTVDQIPALSAAQQVIACYRAVHGSAHARGCATTGAEQRRLSQIPDDQRSMYTLALSSDRQSTMDMMWRPKPKVHMRRTDQRALMRAQSQAIAMMQDAGLKPTNKIQCRRRGCADILPDVEALKYHIHIHDIADSASRCTDASSAARKRSLLAECSTPHSKAPKRNHFRSKSSFEMQQKRPATYPLPRKLSAGSLLPSFFSPRESTPEVSEAPSLTTVAKALTPDPSTNKLAGLLPMHDDKAPSTLTSRPSCGRRKRKDSMAVSVDAECSRGITMLLSPPSSPMRGRLVLTPHAKMPIPAAFGSSKDSKSDNDISIRKESAHPVSEQLMESRSPVRALSPTRAMSPIRDGIKRILSIGWPDNVTDK